MTKLTEMEESFCQAILTTENSSDAMRASLYNTSNMKPATINRNACALLKKDKIITRIAVLKERAMKRHDVSVDSLVKELEEARAVAQKIASPSAMVSASMGKAKLHGLLVDKATIEGGDPDKPLKFYSKVEIVHVTAKGRPE